MLWKAQSAELHIVDLLEPDRITQIRNDSDSFDLLEEAACYILYNLLLNRNIRPEHPDKVPDPRW